MQTKAIIFTLMLASLLFPGEASAQKELLDTQEEVVAAAVQELDALVADEKFQTELKKEKIRGSYTYQFTVMEKGMVASMLFIEKSEDADIKGQNYLNRFVREHKFSFKVPKGKFYKFNYTFLINN